MLLVEAKPVLGIIVEVQLSVDPRKRFSWPVYRSGLRARLECPTCILVVTPSERVAKWATARVELGMGDTFHAQVLGPTAVPVIRDPERARVDPELAVLSAMAHGKGAPKLALDIAKTAAEGVGEAAELKASRRCLP